MNIVFHHSESHYGVGSASIGGGKVFWLPYSYPDRERLEVLSSLGVDNAFILSHELSHAYGSNTEFVDTWNDLVALKTLMEIGINTKTIDYSLSTYALAIIYNRNRKQKDRRYLEAFHMMRYLYRTFGEKAMSGYMLGAMRHPEDVQDFNNLVREEITGKFGRSGNK
jgi:hypothetical protein